MGMGERENECPSCPQANNNITVDSEVKLCATMNFSQNETFNNACISQKKDLEDKCV